jgi:hypothetical protein
MGRGVTSCEVGGRYAGYGGKKGDMPERSNRAVSKTVAGLVTTLGSNPTLSAGYKIPHWQLRLHLLPDLIILVVEMSMYKGSATGVISTPEIAQCPLGDLAFKVRYPHCTYSSFFVNTLWDIGNWISTPVLFCPVSASTSQLFLCVTNPSIQKRLLSS